MDLTERIKLLKEQLRELDHELKNVESAWFETIDSLEDTRKSLEKPLTQEGLKVMTVQYKHVMMTQIEVFRTNSKIIRKISPTAGDYLDKKINEFEKNDIEFQRLNFHSPDVTQDQIEPLMIRYHELYDEIHDLIEIFRTIIKDTIKKFEE